MSNYKRSFVCFIFSIITCSLYAITDTAIKYHELGNEHKGKGEFDLAISYYSNALKIMIKR